MPAFIYLLLSVLAGREITERFLLRRVRESNGNRFWLLFPMSFASGTLLLTWIVYGISYGIAVYGTSERPLFWGNAAVFFLTGFWLLTLWIVRRINGRKSVRKDWVNDPAIFRKEVWFFAVLFLFLTWILFYVFYVSDDTLYAGLTVFSDYAPHTAMIRSFSLGNNFPTQYPHFGGEDVKYHFMFQFLTGNLEYLGLRIDLAYNLVSLLSLWGFLCMLYKLTCRIMGRCLTGAVAVCIFFFRSGLSFFYFVRDHLRAGDLLHTLAVNTTFIGYTQNENWGLWCFNVYLNQRHLAFGLLIVCMALWCFLDWLEDGDAHMEKGILWMRNRLFSAEAWRSRDLATAAALGCLLGLTAFWNGAAVIGGLLILAGMAVFSDGKLDYAIMAAITIVLSMLQSRFFMTGSAFEFSFYWGLLSYDRSLAGGLWYLIELTGVYFLGLVVIGVVLKRMQRSCMAAFLVPLLFAFTISLTPDIAVNHKYVMMAYAFSAMFWAYVLVQIWRKKHGFQIVAVTAAICLLSAGIYDFVIIVRNNGTGHRIAVDLASDTTAWLAENLTEKDLILTPEYSINEVTMSGAMLYCGWPYYAWSAGYDTYRRAEIASEIYSSEDPLCVEQLLEEEGITYVLFEQGMEFEGVQGREEVLAEVGTLVYTSGNGWYRIYQIV